jgi:serine/threonine protein kinase
VDGTVKVLDFGLAKLTDPVTRPSGSLSPGGGEGWGEGASQAPTLTTPAATRMGLILGTAAYMSPEQASGLAVDKRCDVWAFGYRAAQTMMAVTVTDGPPSTWGTPERLFEGPYVFSLGPRHVDIAPDGRRFLMIAQDAGATDGSPLSQIIVVQHWFEELKRLVPGN